MSSLSSQGNVKTEQFDDKIDNNAFHFNGN